MYDWTPAGKNPVEIFEVLMKPPDENLTCTVPNCVSRNVSFLVDSSSLMSWADWKSDDMGCWKNNGVQELGFALNAENICVPVNEKRDEGAETYSMKRIYYKNKASPDVKKIASYLTGIHHHNILFNS